MAHPAVTITGLTRGSHAGAVVVIDVIRAFTTAAAAFAIGAREILCVEGLEDARALARDTPGALLMGEERGQRPEGFDFGNSPVQFHGHDLTDRVIVQRTSNGTRGLAWSTAPLLLAGAAVNASATARVAVAAPPVTLICTAETSEDMTCAEHLEQLLTGEPVRLAETRDRILAAADEPPSVLDPRAHTGGRRRPRCRHRCVCRRGPLRLRHGGRALHRVGPTHPRDRVTAHTGSDRPAPPSTRSKVSGGTIDPK
ncbi:MAG: 2-phosphosulfolactate phosphatase [Acidimicrobiales bacterium]